MQGLREMALDTASLPPEAPRQESGRLESQGSFDSLPVSQNDDISFLQIQLFRHTYMDGIVQNYAVN